MEKLARQAARKIGEAQHANEERIAVMVYGLTALFQLVFIFLAACLIGGVCGFFAEAMIVFFSVGVLRRLIGGAHSADFNHCLIISVLCIALFSALSKYVFSAWGVGFVVVFSGVVYLLAVILIALLAPVDSPNKPVRSVQKRRRLRRQAFAALALLILLTAAALFLWPGSALCRSCLLALDLSVLWQVLMLTKVGHTLVCMIDRTFRSADYNT